VIAKGFAVNHGKPGSILAPSGLAYDASIDTLYIVDGTNNTVVSFDNVTTIPNGGIIVEKVRRRRQAGLLRLSARRSD
jgi:hypothetical protein